MEHTFALIEQDVVTSLAITILGYNSKELKLQMNISGLLGQHLQAMSN